MALRTHCHVYPTVERAYRAFREARELLEPLGAVSFVMGVRVTLGNDHILFTAVSSDSDLHRLAGAKWETLTNHGADPLLVQHLWSRVRPTLEKQP